MTEQKPVNISVAIRCRPLSKQELTRPSNQVILHDQSLIEIQPKASQVHASSRVYQFDQIFGPSTTQEDFYRMSVSPILKDFVQGYNCSVFAYGMTGSGKSWSMFGPDQIFNDQKHFDLTQQKDAGAIPRAVYELFSILTKQQTDYQLRVSHVEVYNEDVFDLLLDDQQFREPLKIIEEKQLTTSKNKVLLQNVTEVLVKTPSEVINLIQKSNLNKKVAETKMNDHSSRSHSIFTIQLIQKSVEITAQNQETEFIKISKMNLIDLAGSESQAKSGVESQSLRQQEASKINKSLLTLGRVINSLVENQSFVPYRDSKLTRLLSDSLGGKTKTCIIATISQTDFSVEETANTLEYMTRAKKIKNMPEITQKVNSRTVLKEYSQELQRLRELVEIQKAQQGGVFVTNEEYLQYEDFLKNRNERIQQLTEQITQLSDEMERIQQVLEMQGEKYKIVKHELKKAVDVYEKQVEDLNIFQLKLERGKEEEKRNSSSFEQMKEAVAHKVYEISSPINQQTIQKQFKTDLETLQNLIDDHINKVKQQVAKTQQILVEDIQSQTVSTLSLIKEKTDSVSVQITNMFAALLDDSKKPNFELGQETVMKHIQSFIQQVIQTQMQDITTTLQSNAAKRLQSIKELNTMLGQQITEQQQFGANLIEQINTVQQNQEAFYNKQSERLVAVKTAMLEEMTQNKQTLLQQIQQQLELNQQKENDMFLEHVQSLANEQQKQNEQQLTAVLDMNTQQDKNQEILLQNKAAQTQRLEIMAGNVQKSRQQIEQLVDKTTNVLVDFIPVHKKQVEQHLTAPGKFVQELVVSQVQQLQQAVGNLKAVARGAAQQGLERSQLLIIDNSKAESEKLVVSLSKQFVSADKKYINLTQLQRDADLLIARLGQTMRDAVEPLQQFVFSSQLVNQSIRTPYVPSTPQLEAVVFPNGAQTGAIMGVRVQQTPGK